MKMIIKGRQYNTDTAREVAIAAHGDGNRSYTERLYRKRTGEYFLAGLGGAGSKYHEYVEECDAYIGGSKIFPLSYQEAIEWAEAEMDAEDYEAEFGAVSEGDTVHMHISLPADVADRIRKAAASEGISVSECVGRRF